MKSLDSTEAVLEHRKEDKTKPSSVGADYLIDQIRRRSDKDGLYPEVDVIAIVYNPNDTASQERVGKYWLRALDEAMDKENVLYRDENKVDLETTSTSIEIGREKYDFNIPIIIVRNFVDLEDYSSAVVDCDDFLIALRKAYPKVRINDYSVFICFSTNASPLFLNAYVAIDRQLFAMLK